MQKQSYIIDGIRTPIGNFGGTLSTIRTDDLGAHVIRELMVRNPNLPKEA
ncbi:MAG: 3-oxoadipyl-CoA thiolase, partial [Bacteroidota bacterium]